MYSSQSHTPYVFVRCRGFAHPLPTPPPNPNPNGTGLPRSTVSMYPCTRHGSHPPLACERQHHVPSHSRPSILPCFPLYFLEKRRYLGFWLHYCVTTIQSYQGVPITPPPVTMNKYLAGTLTVLFWIVWPIYIVLYYLAVTMFAILKVLYWPIAFVLQPVVYLLRFIAACLALPFRALVKLEVSDFHLNICTESFLILSTPASVQLPWSCSTRGPARWTGTLLHLQHLSPPPSTRLRSSASQGTTHRQTIPGGESSLQGKI